MSTKFNGHGYLEPGIHTMAKSDIETSFVISFPHSTTRQKILQGYEKHSQEVVSLVGSCEQYLDGSFVTTKNDPGDIDMVIIMDATVVDALPLPEQLKLRELVAGPSTKSKYMCDAYYCPRYPAGHAMADAARQQHKYWLGEFGFDRNDIPKGIVCVVLAAASPTTSTP